MKQRYPKNGGTIDCLDRSLSPGVYWLQSSRGDTNIPYGLNYGSLIVLSNTIRLFVLYQSRALYVNDYVNSKWQGWKRYSSSTAEFFPTSGVDLNNYIYGGAYFSSAFHAGVDLNFPYNGAGWLEVIEFKGESGTDFCLQKYYVWGSTKLYTRSHNANGWTSWSLMNGI